MNDSPSSDIERKIDCLEIRICGEVDTVKYCHIGEYVNCPFYQSRNPKKIIKDILLHRPGKQKEGI